MPEAAQDIHDSKDLGNQVGALLDQMQAGTQRLNDEVATAVPPATDAEPAPLGGDALADAVAALASQAAPDAAATPPDLASAVEKLIQESGAPRAPEPAPAAAPASKAEKIESLDADLAGQADSVIAGEFADEAEVLKEQAPEPTLAAPAPEPVKTEPPRPSRPIAEPADEALPPPVELPPAAAPQETESVRPAAPGAKPPAPAPAPSGPSMLLRAMSAASAPVHGKPHVRDTLGWAALVTAFWGACFWIWLLFFRPDRPLDPPPVTPAKEKAEETSGHGAKKPAGHEEKKSSGHEEKKPAEKKPAKKTTAKAAGHH